MTADAPSLPPLDTLLLPWYDACHRDLPWRQTTDPYRIWVSEIMLQQTRVETVIGYYHRFIGRFPDVAALARADSGDVLKAWEGLGYYARARNLQAAARRLVEQGRDTPASFPRTAEELLALPGIGRYTVGAILSIAFGLPHAALDGNVRRVLSRLLADARPPRVALPRLDEEAQHLVRASSDPSRHNQAMMELGALVCVPASPRCDACPLRSACRGHATGRPESYPAPKPRKVVPHEQMVAGVVRDGEGRILIWRRPPRGLLGGLWDVPAVTLGEGDGEEDACHRAAGEHGLQVRVDEKVAVVRHAYTHFRVTVHAWTCTLVGQRGVSDTERVRWVLPHRLADHAFPNVTRLIFEALQPGAHHERGLSNRE